MTQQEAAASFPDRLAGAANVAIILHGVGDHSNVDILKEARAAIASIEERDEISTEILKVSGLEFPTGTQKDPTALEVLNQGDRHLVVPVVWSSIRKRAEDEWKKTSKSSDITAIIIAPLGASIRLCFFAFDLFRCSLRASRPGKKVLVVLASILALGIALVFVGSALGAAGFIVQLISGNLTLSGFSLLIFCLVVAAVIVVAMGTLPLVDLVWDVAHYVGNRRRRDQLAEELCRLIQEIGQKAPNAYILVAGHSLGSVLVSRAVVKLLNTWSDASERIVVVTMGSPLKKMYAFFPNDIVSPEEFERSLLDTTAVWGWVNIWRDSDYVGRSLLGRSEGKYCEFSIGSGGHGRYFSDQRVWRALNHLLVRIRTDSPGDICGQLRELGDGM